VSKLRFHGVTDQRTRHELFVNGEETNFSSKRASTARFEEKFVVER